MTIKNRLCSTVAFTLASAFISTGVYIFHILGGDPASAEMLDAGKAVKALHMAH